MVEGGEFAQARIGSVGHGHGDGTVEGDDGGGPEFGEPVVEGDDLRPVGFGVRGSLGMKRGNRRLQDERPGRRIWSSSKGHSASGFRWNASYALAATTDHTSLDTGPVPTGIVDYDHSAPSHVVIGGIGYSADKWELDLMGRRQSSDVDYRLDPTRTMLLAENVDNYVTMNARIGYRVTEHVTVAVTAQQFNAPYLAETAGPPVQRQILLSLTAHL